MAGTTLQGPVWSYGDPVMQNPRKNFPRKVVIRRLLYYFTGLF